MTLRIALRATSTLYRVGVLAPILATLWVFGFVSLTSPMPSREWAPSTSILINRWPQLCEELVIPGQKLPPVKIDLGLSITAGPDFLHVDFGVDRVGFDRRLREQIAWLSPTSPLIAERPESFREAAVAEYAAVLRPSRMAELFTSYRAAEKRARRADQEHFVRWLVTLTAPPTLVLLAGYVLQQRLRRRGGRA